MTEGKTYWSMEIGGIGRPYAVRAEAIRGRGYRHRRGDKCIPSQGAEHAFNGISLLPELPICLSAFILLEAHAFQEWGESPHQGVVLCPFFFEEAGRIGFYSSCLPSEGETCCKTGSILPRGRDTLPLLSSLLLPPLREGGKFVRSIDGGLWDDEGLFSSSSPESVDSTNLLLFLRRALRDALGGSETVGEGRQARSCFISPLSQLFSARSSSICLESRSMSPSPRIILARVAMTFVAALTRITDSCNFFTRLPLSPLEHLAMLKMVTERSISR